MQFLPLFTAGISHTYYSHGCRDFSFVIPADSRQLLKNGKLVAKVLDGKLYVLFAADEAGTPLISLAGKTLRLGLKLLNPCFSNFTQLNFDFNSSRLLYRNFTNSGALDEAQAVTLIGQRFSHIITEVTRPVTVRLKNSNGQILETETITATSNRPTVAYDLTRQLVGAYSIEEVYSSQTKTINYYADFELQQQGIFTIIEIRLAANFYTTPPEFNVAFTAKEETLKYYIVAQNYSDTDFNQLLVSDGGEAGRTTIAFSPRILPAAFTNSEISPSLLGNNDAKIVLFKSQQPVIRQEKSRQKIRLHKNGEVLIPHLPQPSMKKINSDLIIQLAKP